MKNKELQKMTMDELNKSLNKAKKIYEINRLENAGKINFLYLMNLVFSLLIIFLFFYFQNQFFNLGVATFDYLNLQIHLIWAKVIVFGLKTFIFFGLLVFLYKIFQYTMEIVND